MDFLLKNYQAFMEFTNGNPIFGSAVFVTLFSAAMLAVRNHVFTIPAAIWRVISRFIYSELYFKRDDRWEGDTTSLTFTSVMAWYASTKMFAKTVRSFRPTNVYIDGRQRVTMEAGLGLHFFTFAGSIGTITRWETVHESMVNQHMKIRYFGSMAKLQKLTALAIDFYKNQDSEGRLIVYKPGEHNWYQDGKVRDRNIDTVILHGDTLEKIIAQIKDFLSKEQWYLSRGFTWKLIILLEGPPGTGKTSLVKAVTTYFQRDLYRLSLSDGKGELSSTLSGVGDNAIVLAEDIDAEVSTGNRGTQNESEVNIGKLFGTPLSSILNALDGVMTPHGLIMFMTTNHMEKLDPALIRDERVDQIYHIGLLEHSDVCRYIYRMYPGATIPTNITFASVAGSKLQKTLKLYPNLNQVDQFIAALDKLPAQAKIHLA